MAVLVVVLVVAVIGVVVAIVVALMNSSNKQGSQTASPRGVDDRPIGGSGPKVTSFHVKGDTAITGFDAPLGTAQAGQHLIDILSLASVEFLHQKQKSGLPLSEVTKIDVQATRSGEPESITVIDLPAPGQLPSASAMRPGVEAASDPIGSLTKVVADTSVVPTPTTKGELPAVAAFIQMSGPTEAALQATGADPTAVSLRDLATGLFSVSGYEVLPARAGAKSPSGDDADSFRVTKAGKSTSVVLLPHEPDSYPEVADKVFTEISVLAGQVGGDTVLFITDKFGPYSMYERERRDKRVVFVTRERLQAFVDSFGLG